MANTLYDVLRPCLDAKFDAEIVVLTPKRKPYAYILPHRVWMKGQLNQRGLDNIKATVLARRQHWAQISVDTADYERDNEATDNAIANAVLEEMDALLTMMGVPIPDDPEPTDEE